MKICKKYEFTNDEYTCKYLVQVHDNFICVNRFDLGQNGEMKSTEHIQFSKDFAYEIAKKIIEEYEKMNSVPNQQKEYEYRADLFRGAE